jgi:hypothetical protein
MNQRMTRPATTNPTILSTTPMTTYCPVLLGSSLDTGEPGGGRVVTGVVTGDGSGLAVAVAEASARSPFRPGLGLGFATSRSFSAGDGGKCSASFSTEPMERVSAIASSANGSDNASRLLFC